VINLFAFLALFLPPVWANTVFGLIVLTGFAVVFWLDFRKLK
jgi:hypothetical protein